MKDKLFLIFLGGFTLGILFRSFFNLGFSFVLFIMLIAGAICLVELVRPAVEKYSKSQVLALFVFSIALGVLRFDVSELGKIEPRLEQNLNQQITLRGVIHDEPDERESSTQLTVLADSINLGKGGNFTTVRTKVLVTADLYPKFKYGDRVELLGRVEKPKNFIDPSGKIFDYQNYLAKDSIYYQIYRPHISLLASGEGNFIISILFKAKQKFIKNIEALIPEPHSSLLGGLVVGAKQSLGKKLLDDFRHAGVIHIVVLSGYNITIIGYFIQWIFTRLRKNLRLILASVAIILFAIMVGASATVVRASVMALLVLLAQATGRKYEISRALIIAGFLMILQNPKILVFDSSFQLSFMSTIALILISPIIENRLHFITNKFGLRDIVTATLSTQVFVLPMILYKMGELSLVALPVNLLILSAIPATMFFGFLAGIIGFVSIAIAFPFAIIAYGLLTYELQVVEFFSHLPFAFLAIGSFPIWLTIMIYLVYLIGIMFLNKKVVANIRTTLVS